VDADAIEVFGGAMVGCAGIVTWPNRDTLCAPGWTACTAQQWVDRRAGAAPDYNYWNAEDLRYNGGGSANCWVSVAVGSSCGANQPMRVCTAGGDDALGNVCNWENCGWGAIAPNEYFGGCVGNLTAGTLCCQ